MIVTSQISIIIPAYNASPTIARAIKSALAEPEVVEVIVVDDCSSDDTVDAARACDDGSGRLKVFEQTQNGGPAAARNRALAESAAPWVALLDSDDFLLPGRMAGLLAHAGEADFIADDLWKVDEADPDGPRVSLIGKTDDLPRFIDFEEFVLSNVTQSGKERQELGFIKPLMRRAFLDEHHIRYRADMRLGEDYELYARALAAGARLLLLPAQGYVAVVRAGSLSGQHSEQDLQLLRDCNQALRDDFSLTKGQKAALEAHYRDTDCRLQWRLLIVAVKNRDIGAALKCFARPWPVPLYLAARLWEQFILRVFRKGA